MDNLKIIFFATINLIFSIANNYAKAPDIYIPQSQNIGAVEVSPVPGITSQMKENAEKVIRGCEAKFLDVKNNNQMINDIPKPHMLSLNKAAKIAYQKKELYQAAFDKNFAEFVKFTNEKINIRKVYTSYDPKLISSFPDMVNAYNSNCTRFSEGLKNFLEWASSGEVKHKGYERIFMEWIKDTK